jgi:phosphomannomutase
VKDLVERASNQNDEKAMEELTSLFPADDSRISFGTAGLRSDMKPGPLGMNDLTIVQTAQGLARYCLKQDNKISDKVCAVIAYDHRCNPELKISSLSFAILTALVFAEAGIDCILLEGFVLTPLVPFALQRVGAVAGIMVTASHNPKQDDGYKVYASDGCQIRAPMETEISAEIMDNLEPWKDYGKIIEVKQQEYKDDPCLGLSSPEMTQELLDAYFAALLSSGLMTGQAKMQHLPSSLSPPSFAYTAMHGIGHKFASKVFEVFELPPFKAVPAQKDPDFTSPTVPFPNPEEKGALDLAKKYAEENGCDIVLANDPDADRLAVAERDRSSGDWTVFSGDQIGTMLGHWIWNQIGKNCGKVRILVYKYRPWSLVNSQVSMTTRSRFRCALQLCRPRCWPRLLAWKDFTSK